MCSRFKYRTLDILLEDYKHYNEMTLVTVIDGFTLLKHRIPVVINITQIEWSKQIPLTYPTSPFLLWLSPLLFLVCLLPVS